MRGRSRYSLNNRIDSVTTMENRFTEFSQLSPLRLVENHRDSQFYKFDLKGISMRIA